MDRLAKLFGSSAKVKIMRLFLFNPTTVFENGDVSRRAGVRADSIRKVTSSLQKAGLIKKKSLPTSPSRTKAAKKGKRASSRRRSQGWILDESCPYIPSLRTLLLPADALSDSQIEKKFKKTGKIKLLLVSGAFLHTDDSRVDVFVVADSIRSNQLSSTIKDLEAHVGTELKYAALAPEDFVYRMNIRDKLVRDIFECPHKVILDKIGISR